LSEDIDCYNEIYVYWIRRSRSEIDGQRRYCS